MSPRLRTLAASGLLLLAGGGALYAATDGFRAFTTESARRLAVMRHPVTIPAATLQTQTGGQINLTDLRGRWLLVDFIYTRCPGTCITLGAEFAQLEQQLEAEIEDGKVQLLSISFDPRHDTPGQLAMYLRHAHSDGHGWTAARPVGDDTLDQLVQSFGITVVPDGRGGYTHNAAIHVVDPQGRLVEILDLEQSDQAVRRIMRGLES